MLRIRAATPLEGRRLRLTLADGSVVERDISDFISWGEVYERLATDDAYFRRVRVRYGTVAWPGNVDIAAELMIWGGPDPGVSPSPMSAVGPGLIDRADHTTRRWGPDAPQGAPGRPGFAVRPGLTGRQTPIATIDRGWVRAAGDGCPRL